MNRRHSRIDRRSFLTGTVGGIAGLSVLDRVSLTERVQAQPSSASNSDDDWTQYRADAGHTAYLKDGVGPTGNIKQAWTKSGSRNLLSIAVVDETVYVGAEKLIALNRADGSERWKMILPQSTNGVPFDGVARVGDLLYIEEHALDPTDGAVVWKWGTSPEKDWNLRAVAGGQAYLNRSTSEGWKLTALTGKPN